MTLLPNYFADDASVFFVVNDLNVSADQVNQDLDKISMWADQWKMFFNPDISKKAQESSFSKKSRCFPSPSLL